MNNRALAPLMRRIRLMINRSVLRLVDDSKQMQAVQVDATAGETLDEVEHWQPYGFSAHAKPGGEVLLVSAGGKRATPVAVSVADRRYRITGLAAGEVCIHDDQGQKVTLFRDRIEVESATKIVLKTPEVEITGNLNSSDGGTVDLGGSGGERVARIGDRVQIDSGSSAGLWPIVEGSSSVRAVD